MVLVTGASGLVGSHLTYQLLMNDKRVRVLLRAKSSLTKIREVFGYYSGNANDLIDRLDIVYGDILNTIELSSCFTEVEEVYHCAALVSFNPKQKNVLLKTNIEGTANVVNACINNKIRKLVHVSSIAAVGPSEDGIPRNENNFPSSTNSNYSYSKTKSEFEVWRGIEEGLNAVIVNPSIILGPGFWETGSSKLFSSVAKGMKYYVSGETGFVGVWDVVRAMIDLMASNIASQRFILNAENLSYQKLFESIAKEINVVPPTKKATPRLLKILSRVSMIVSFLTGKDPMISPESAAAAVRIQHYSSEKIKSEFGFSFEPISQVIRKVVTKMFSLKEK